MTRVMNKFQSSSLENICFQENGFSTEQEIDVHFYGNLCDKNALVYRAINSFAANYACDGRGKLFRRITRSARKGHFYFMKKQGLMEAKSTRVCISTDNDEITQEYKVSFSIKNILFLIIFFIISII